MTARGPFHNIYTLKVLILKRGKYAVRGSKFGINEDLPGCGGRVFEQFPIFQKTIVLASPRVKYLKT
jgi:hypothetical protein